MTKIIESLREEHRNIEEVLLVLEHELNIFSRGGRPDYEIINAVISYFLDYPDCCHHPKEDMIFEKLKARDPVAAESVGDLEGEHRNESQRLRRVSDMIRGILTNEEAPGQTFDNVMRDFVEQERRHMKMEERVLFSSAVTALRPEDWAVIESRWRETKDSLFNVAIEEKCESIREHILHWQRENSEGWMTPDADSAVKSQH
ncbi:MAG: hemerythrin domain-containing protein [Xanthobacteraceae bacterium]